MLCFGLPVWLRVYKKMSIKIADCPPTEIKKYKKFDKEHDLINLVV